MKLDTKEAKLDRAKQLRSAARTKNEEATKLEREIAEMDRKQEAQMLCALGRAWIALGERSPTGRDGMLQFLRNYISRDTDRKALLGTPWDVTAPAPENNIESHQAETYESHHSEQI